MWMICYKPTPEFPSGRAVAMPGQFETKEQAQTFIDDKGFDWMHPVETDGKIQVSPPAK